MEKNMDMKWKLGFWGLKGIRSCRALHDYQPDFEVSLRYPLPLSYMGPRATMVVIIQAPAV